jgi:translation initiation factor 1
MDFDESNLKSYDSLASASKVHIRFQKTGPRSLTTVEGLDQGLDYERMAKSIKKRLNCAATVINIAGAKAIQVQGQHTAAVKEWIVANGILTKEEAADRVVIHGGF